MFVQKLVKSLNSSCTFFDRARQPGHCNQQVTTKTSSKLRFLFSGRLLSNIKYLVLRQAAVNHSILALIVFYAYCTVGAATEEKKTN